MSRCETPMCECHSKGICPRDRRDLEEDVSKTLCEFTSALATCEDHYHSCRECRYNDPCLKMLALQEQAKKVAVSRILMTHQPEGAGSHR
jgi:hypothetical protein